MNRVRSTAIAVAVLVTTAIAVPAVAGVVTAQERGQQIDECTTINESGAYELNASIGANESANATNETAGVAGETGLVEDDVNASACIAVEASDVAFDGNGNTLDGSNASALNLTNASVNASDDATTADGNESVVNGIVVRPPADEESVSNVTVTNVTVQHWYVGVYIQDASDVTLDNVTFANNTVPGFRLVNATDMTIRNVTQTTAQAD